MNRPRVLMSKPQLIPLASPPGDHPQGWTEYCGYAMYRVDAKDGSWRLYAAKSEPGQYKVRPLGFAWDDRPFEMYIAAGEITRTHVESGQTEVRTAPWNSWDQKDRTLPAGRYKLETTKPGTLTFCFIAKPGTTLPISKEEGIALVHKYIDTGVFPW